MLIICLMLIYESSHISSHNTAVLIAIFKTYYGTVQARGAKYDRFSKRTL